MALPFLGLLPRNTTLDDALRNIELLYNHIQYFEKDFANAVGEAIDQNGENGDGALGSIDANALVEVKLGGLVVASRKSLNFVDGTNNTWVISDDGSLINQISISVNGYTDEQAQDTIGGILVDSSTINFTYSDSTPSITAEVILNSITNSYLATMPSLTIKGNNTGSVGNVLDLTASQARVVILGAVDAGWTLTNVTTDRTYDADATSVAELADVLGTLIGVLITKGILGA